MSRIPSSRFQIGQRVNDWTVIGDVFMVVRPNKNRSYTPCRCVCGTEKMVLTQNLNNGISTSCGCIGHERQAAVIRKHGQCGTRLYRIWKGMNVRCSDAKHKKYQYYGGKGIRVCEEWREFIPFAAWSQENGYAEDLTIDRIESSGDYCPDNCRWSTWKVQKRNTSRNRFLTAFGETKTLADWAEDPRCSVAGSTIQWYLCI